MPYQSKNELLGQTSWVEAPNIVNVAEEVTLIITKHCHSTLDEAAQQAVNEKIRTAIENNDPIHLSMCYSLQKFPLTDDEEDPKCGTKSPDLAELAFLQNLHNLAQDIKNCYPQGAVITIYDEAPAFLAFSAYDEQELLSFRKQLQRWLIKLGWEQEIVFVDLLEECTKKNPDYLTMVSSEAEKIEAKLCACMAKLRIQDVIETSFTWQHEASPEHFYHDYGTLEKVMDHLWKESFPHQVLLELKNVFVAGLNSDQLLRIFSTSGIVPLTGAQISCDSLESQDYAVIEMMIRQAIHQAAYFEAFMQARKALGINGVYQPETIALTITRKKNALILPTGMPQVQDKYVNETVFPSAGVGVKTPDGIVTMPKITALSKGYVQVFDPELEINYYIAE